MKAPIPPMARTANAPTCPYHGSFVRLISMTVRYRGLSGHSRWRIKQLPTVAQPGSSLRLLKLRLDAELDEIASRRRRLGLAVDNLHRLLEISRVLQVGDEVGERRQHHAAAVDDDVVAGLLELGEPQHRRQSPAHLVEHVDRLGLPLPELLDELHALLQLRLALFELLHLHDDRMQPRRFLLRFGEV